MGRQIFLIGALLITEHLLESYCSLWWYHTNRVSVCALLSPAFKACTHQITLLLSIDCFLHHVRFSSASVVADGIIDAVRANEMKQPIVVRVKGTGSDVAKEKVR